MQLVYETLVDSAALRNPSDEVILKYREQKTNQQFMETVGFERLIPSDYKELLSVVLNQNYEVIAINYSQQKLKRKELSGIEAPVHRSQQAKEFILTYQPAKKANEQQQEESFFTKYRWYILGGLGLLFLMSKADPEAMQQQMQQQQQPRN